MEKLFSELADQFHNRTWLSIVIEGHTDSHASQDYNMKLAYRRTNSVKAALIRVGFPEELIVELPKGESQPVASNETSVGRQLNRRVKVWFTQ
jgi:outer membrane protein OmpA-like peptidoglycan-associated protein